MIEKRDWTIKSAKREIDAIRLEIHALEQRRVRPQTRLEALTEERRELSRLLDLLVPEAHARAERFAEFWKSLPGVIMTRGGVSVDDGPIAVISIEGERGLIGFNLDFSLEAKILGFNNPIDASWPPEVHPSFSPLAIEIGKRVPQVSPRMNKSGTRFEWEGVNIESIT